MITHIQIAEARSIARQLTHTDFQKKRLIKIYLMLNGFNVQVWDIKEDHKDFDIIFEHVLKFFRNEPKDKTDTKKIQP